MFCIVLAIHEHAGVTIVLNSPHINK